ncbi:autotransporter family protein [Desulfovibrio piger]|uniref:autotransporter family protein n=1 Tax=Desulfovibrio piger TaxID=901 RepID=UPI0026F32218|nr:autotransporter domain-containing protein [Desulfovibrio piger]
MSTGDYLIAIDNTVFSKNEIHSKGNLRGSIINNKKDHKVTINSSSFESNISTVKGDYALGGAIYNEGELTFTGNNTFTDNIINDKPNDIHNSGNVTVTSGTTTLGSGYSQDKGSLTVKGGAALESLGTMEITGGSVAFEDNSLFAVNGNNLTGNNAAISLSGDASMTVDDTARLRINNAKNGQTYTIVNDDSNTPTNSVWTGNIEASSDMLDMTVDQDGNVTAEAKDASEVFTGMDGDTAAIVNGLYGKGLNNTDADAMGVRFLSRATDNRFLGADKDAAAATIESAARIAFAGAVPQMTKMASDAGSNAVVNRLGFANPADGAQAMDAEGKIVDRNTTGFALWIAPLWQSQHGWGMEADNLDYGFNGNLGGVSLGADYTFENAIRAGITFNIGGGYAESSGGDLNSTENRMSFWGLGAYAGWNYENFGLMADVSYTSTWNDLKQDMDSRMGMGDLEADVQASAISAGLRAEYKLETSVLDVIPHIGVRYMSLNTWGFDAESNGGTVLEGDGFHQDIWTFPVGVTFTKDFTLDSGWSFKPSIDFSVIPAAGDIKAKQDVAFTGLPGSYEVETQMMDYLTWQGGVGLEMGNDTMSFGVNYTLQAGQHTTGHGVFGSFRYEF